MGDLVRRLRDRAEYNFGSCMCDLCAEQCVRCKDAAVQTEAADAIESLTARLAAAEEALRGNAAFIKAQAEERARVRAETLEEAAKVARDYGSKAKQRGWTTAPDSAAKAAQHIAQNIRALATQENTDD
jgi:hypothetical protein